MAGQMMQGATIECSPGAEIVLPESKKITYNESGAGRLQPVTVPSQASFNAGAAATMKLAGLRTDMQRGRTLHALQPPASVDDTARCSRASSIEPAALAFKVGCSEPLRASRLWGCKARAFPRVGMGGRRWGTIGALTVQANLSCTGLWASGSPMGRAGQGCFVRPDHVLSRRPAARVPC